MASEPRAQAGAEQKPTRPQRDYPSVTWPTRAFAVGAM
jgi:hypothetical protein